jgi:hypothetical protein
MATGTASVTTPEADEGIAPPVRLEPCAELRLDHDAAWPVCAACGWLEDEHAPAGPGGAVVTELPRRAPWPERKAS